ncbi:MAG: hypothetical protein NTY77_05585 [Elusimicrobia bacterium]|nr:hypothetical protein [Elusimicrobiota bacterium]
MLLHFLEGYACGTLTVIIYGALWLDCRRRTETDPRETLGRGIFEPGPGPQ